MIVAVAVAACRQAPPRKQPSQASTLARAPVTGSAMILDREWVLTALGDHSSPTGAGGRPATLRLESATKRASGFAGCNRYGATYVLTADSLRFGPSMSTKMACAEGDELERAFLAALAAVSTYQVSDSTLSLMGSGGVVARFKAR